MSTTCKICRLLGKRDLIKAISKKFKIKVSVALIKYKINKINIKNQNKQSSRISKVLN